MLVLGSSSPVSWKLLHRRDVTCLNLCFSGSAIAPWSLNREFFCLRMFSLLFLQRNTSDLFLSCHFCFFNSSFGGGGRYRLERSKGLRAKASGQVAGLQVPEMWRFVLCN